jgi:glycosyltransferase involved in cell wall biosynthesis
LKLASENFILKNSECRPEKPFVSVIVITYNHAKYIKECLDGVITQKFNFSTECLIADDCSNDGTSKIINSYVKNHPDFLFHIERSCRLGKYTGNAGFNFLHAITLAKGKYIAVCEGDDYWTHPHKLQKQVELLENDICAIGSCHNYYISKSNKLKEFRINKYSNNNKINQIDLIKYGNIPRTCTNIYRTIPLRETIKNLKVPSSDYTLNLAMTKKGYFIFRNAFNSTYRIHKSNTHIVLPIRKRQVKTLKVLNECKFKKIIKSSNKNVLLIEIAKIHFDLATQYTSDNQFYSFFHSIRVINILNIIHNRKDYFEYLNKIRNELKNNNIYFISKEVAHLNEIKAHLIFIQEDYEKLIVHQDRIEVIGLNNPSKKTTVSYSFKHLNYKYMEKYNEPSINPIRI